MKPFLGEEPLYWPEICDAALLEDTGLGDVSRFAVPQDAKSDYIIEAQASGVACGLGLVMELLTPLNDLDDDEFAEYRRIDGELVEGGDVVFAGRLNSRELLTNERTALNFLMHLSGIAALTAKFVKAVKGTKAVILDTRKTLPGLRSIEKYAVRCGGGRNHRMNLSDGIIIKTNHIRAASSVQEAVANARAGALHTMLIEVECETVAQMDRALSAGADLILLDNMALGEIKDAISICRGRALLEVSGGVSIENVREIADTGVDYISIGSLTHSAPALPFHLKVR